MNGAQIVTVVDRMTAAWPWAEWTEAQTDLWCDVLEPLDPADVGHALREAVLKLERPPTVAWFLGTARAEMERRARPVKAIEAPVDVAGRERLVALTRAAVAEVKARGPHNHKGPEPCPVCGGLRPPTLPPA